MDDPKIDWPTGADLTEMVGLENISEQVRSKADHCVRAATRHFTQHANPASYDPEALDHDAHMAIVLRSAQMLRGYGTGGVIVVNDTTLTVSDQESVLSKLEGSYFNWPDPFPTVTVSE